VVASDSPTPETVEADLFDVLTYEDDQWLWEPVWLLNGKYPNLPESEKVGLARQVVLGLAEQQRVTLWRGQWPGGIVEPLNEVDRQRIEGEEAPWTDPEGTDLQVIIQIASVPA
jgi:hypothetical protein